MTTEVAIEKYNLDIAIINELEAKDKGITIRPGNKDDYAFVMTGLKAYRDRRIEVLRLEAGVGADLKIE